MSLLLLYVLLIDSTAINLVVIIFLSLILLWKSVRLCILTRNFINFSDVNCVFNNRSRPVLLVLVWSNSYFLLPLIYLRHHFRIQAAYIRSLIWFIIIKKCLSVILTDWLVFLIDGWQLHGLTRLYFWIQKPHATGLLLFIECLLFCAAASCFCVIFCSFPKFTPSTTTKMVDSINVIKLIHLNQIFNYKIRIFPHLNMFLNQVYK